MTSARAARAFLVGALLATSSSILACTSPVAIDLDETEAEAARRWLAEAGIAAEHVATTEGRSQIRVPTLDAERALARLAERSQRSNASPVSTALVPSRAEAELTADLARARELERSITRLPSVDAAHVVLGPAPRASTLVPGTPPVRSAAVIVTRKRGAAIDPKAVKALISSGIGGVSPEAVEVIDAELPATIPPPALATWGPVSVPESALPALRALFGLSAFLNLLTLGALFHFRKRSLP